MNFYSRPSARRSSEKQFTMTRYTPDRAPAGPKRQQPIARLLLIDPVVGVKGKSSPIRNEPELRIASN
jgi:hypothetical protein